MLMCKMMRHPNTAFCASLRSRDASGHVARTIFCNQKSKRPQSETATHTLREPVQSKRTWISQELLCTENYRENAAPQEPGTHFITRAFLYGHVGKNSRAKQPMSQEPPIGHFIRKFTPQRCASLRSRNVCQHCVNSYKRHVMQKLKGKK